jgi:hypothetical protein
VVVVDVLLVVLGDVVVVDGRVVVEVVEEVVVVVDGFVVVVVLEVVAVVDVLVAVVVDVVVVDGCVVLVVEVVEEVLVVVVVVGAGVIETAQPVALQLCGPGGLQIALSLVSNRLFIASPIEAVAAACAVKVTLATLTTPVGPLRLLVWNAAILVWQLLAVAHIVPFVGVPWNSVVFPPATVATVTRVGS